MVPEDQQEEAALSASEPIVPSNPTVEPEAAESAEGAIAGVTSSNWADLSEEATAPTTGLEGQDLLDAGLEPLDSGELLSAGGAAFGAPGDEASDGEEAPQHRFDALSLLEPPKEEEFEPSTEELFALLQNDPTEEHPESAEPALEEESVPLASEIDNPDNNAALNTESIEESLSALDLEPKEEPDFEAEPEPVAEVSETPAVGEAASSSTTFAPVLYSILTAL